MRNDQDYRVRSVRDFDLPHNRINLMPREYPRLREETQSSSSRHRLEAPNDHHRYHHESEFTVPNSSYRQRVSSRQEPKDYK